MTDLNLEIKLKRTLNLPMLIMFGLAYLAPTVVFNYYGIFTVQTKGMYTLAICITTIIMLLTAISYVQMVKAYPIAGSAYTYVNKSVQPHLGFMTGWVMLLDYMLIPMICYLLLGIYINQFFPIIPVWTIVLVVGCLGAAINIIGMKTASILNSIIIIAQVGFTLLVIVVVAKYVVGGGGTNNLVVPKAIYNPDTFNIANVFAAAAVLCVSFVGFDAVTTLVEETKNPEKTMKPAVLGVVIGAGVLFMLVSYFMQLAWPMAYSEIEDPSVGIFELFPHMGQDWMGNTFFIVDNFATFVCAMSALAAVSRILYSMGRDNIIPKKIFGKLSPRFQTPVINIILTTIVAMTALFYQDNLLGAASLVSFGAISGFIMVNVSVISHYYIRNKRRKGMDFFKYLVLPLIGACSLVVVFVFIDITAKILGLTWLAIGLVYLTIKTKGFRQLPPEMKLEEE